MQLRAIRPSGTARNRKPGQIFSTGVNSAGLPRPDGQPGLVPVRGLWINLVTDSQSDAVLCRLTVGEPLGGGELQRLFTLTRKGVWLEVTSWGVVTLEAVSYSSDPDEKTEITYTWTTQPPRIADDLELVQVIAIGVAQAIPEGARRVALSLADAGWVWVTDQGAPVLLVVQPQPGGGFVNEVLGATFTATVVNTARWSLTRP